MVVSAVFFCPPQEAAEAEMQKLGKQISIDYKVSPTFP